MFVTLDPFGEIKIEVADELVRHWHAIGSSTSPTQPFMADQAINCVFERQWRQFQEGLNWVEIFHAFNAFDEAMGVDWLNHPDKSAAAAAGLVVDAQREAARIGFLHGYRTNMPVIKQVVARADLERVAVTDRNEFDEYETTAYLRVKAEVAGHAGKLTTVFLKTPHDWMLFHAYFDPDQGSVNGGHVPHEQIEVELV